jgi:hypothetical protein
MDMGTSLRIGIGLALGAGIPLAGLALAESGPEEQKDVVRILGIAGGVLAFAGLLGASMLNTGKAGTMLFEAGVGAAAGAPLAFPVAGAAFQG